MMSSARRASSAFRNHGGRIDSCSSVPSSVIGRPPSGLTNSWKGRVFGWPRQKRLAGLTRILAKAAMPGSTTTAGGLTSNLRLRSASVASISADRRWLPRLSTARSCDPELEPREVRGTSSAYGSRKPPTSTVPSSTADPAGSSRERTRRPKGSEPAGVVAARGGRNTAFAAPSAPGNSDRVGGSTAAHAPASPRTSSVNSSTTLPVFLTLTSMETLWPGSTDTAGVTSVTEAPTSGSVATRSAAEQGAWPPGGCCASPNRAEPGLPVKSTLTVRTLPGP